MNEAPELSTTSFIFQQWLDQYPFNRHTVMDYFKHSPFYDPRCNNEVLAMQNKDPSQLVHMKGLEYELADDIKDAFVIRKQQRHAEHSTELLAVFYIIAQGIQGEVGMVFQMPDLHSVCQFNLMTSLYYLNQTVNDLGKYVHSEQGIKNGWNTFDATYSEEVNSPAQTQLSTYDKMLIHAINEAKEEVVNETKTG